MAKKRIKAQQPSQGKNIKVNEPKDYESSPPVFSLEKLQNGKYCLSGLDQVNKAQFADAIYKRKSVTWKEINQCPRHGLGTEKIAKNSINAALPPFITDEVKNLLAFRYNGLQPMVGYRQRDIFYVLWFDHDFTLYDHG